MKVEIFAKSVKKGQEWKNLNSEYDEFTRVDNFRSIINQKRVMSNFEVSKKYVIRGNENYLKRDYCSAREDYEKALEFFPGSSIPYFNLGVIYQKGQCFDEALKYFNKAIKSNPLFCEAYFHRAMLKTKMGFDRENAGDIDKDFNQGVHLSKCKNGDFFKKSDDEFQLIENNIGSVLKSHFE